MMLAQWVKPAVSLRQATGIQKRQSKTED